MLKNYIKVIISKSIDYLRTIMTEEELKFFISKIEYLQNIDDENEVISLFNSYYISYIKELFQKKYIQIDNKLNNFLNTNKKLKIIWGDCLEVLKKMNSESIHLMITSPPYYNAREYSQYENLKIYLDILRGVIKECYRVLDNHRVFVFNIGDIFDNDNLVVKSVWGKRRIPLGAYFIKIFEEEGFTFVDDFIWDKGEVETSRHKNIPFPFYQYPINCYEHIMIFHKHRLDTTRFPCPVCGTLNVNGNTQTEIGLQSWECKNEECFKRSASSRGKRFSLKTNKVQREIKKSNELNQELIKKWRRDIVSIKPVYKINNKGENTLGHTAPFPFEIPNMAINFFSYEGEKILDPFAGSFTTAIEAIKLNRIGIGIEKNKEFRDCSIKNIEKHLTKEIFEEWEF
jgi:DNA modification methylase